ncbi:SDR family NAD(P)-dependent oxidoreductase [Mesobacillus harenae]|uniref:SDR family NAD(P)-dependent oxidoreductase n=1 Tax=Mesobacillus harenae TaxID=2213203 RepID=UPI00157FFDD1|nr:SDR family oxidoreductase [Mesobacillus harenae]
MGKFENYCVIVTGGANGIGKSIVKAFALEEAKVVIADVDENNGRALEQELSEQGFKVLFIKTDVSSEQSIKEMILKTEKSFEQINILINNAGISSFHPFFEMSIKQWDQVINTNLRSVFLCSQEAARYMRKTGGSIINIASTRATMSESDTEAYSASKGGIVAITHALARTLSSYHIRVNSISPGWIQTEGYDELREGDHKQHLTGRVGGPEDISRCCLFLANPENDFITGQDFVIDGGMTKKMIYKP